MSKKLQLTLAIFKPDLTLRPYCVDHVRDMLLQNDFIFVKSKEEHLDPVKVKSFYQEHQGKFFYNRLVTYMSRYVWKHSSEIRVLCLMKCSSENLPYFWNMRAYAGFFRFLFHATLFFFSGLCRHRPGHWLKGKE